MKVLSASEVGHPCDRYLWYIANLPKEKNHQDDKIDSRIKRIFEAGTHLESLVVKFMRDDGYEVYYNGKTHTDPPDFEIYLRGGILVGRYDILFRRPNEQGYTVGDIKTMNRYAYTQWRRKGTAVKYPQYIQQVTVYYKGLKDTKTIGSLLNGKLAIIGFCRDDSQYAVEYFYFSQDIWEEIQERCERIFTAKKPITPKEVPAWACACCSYQSICDANPEKIQDDDTKVIDLKEIEQAAYMLQKAREMQAEARKLEKEAKAVLNKIKDWEMIKAGKYLIKITPIKSIRLDVKALRAQRPDIYLTFAKETVSYRFTVKQVT